MYMFMLPRENERFGMDEMAYISYTGMPLYVAWEARNQSGPSLSVTKGPIFIP